MREYLAKDFIIDEEIKNSLDEGVEKAKEKDSVRAILEKATSYSER